MDMNELFKMMNTDGSQDPRMKMLAQLMAEQNQTQEQAPQQDKEIIKYEKAVQHIQLLGQHNKKLKQANQSLLKNLELMIARNDSLADALGACPDCFGEDKHCNNCRGFGRPGYYEVNPAMFARYIQPFLEKLIKEEAWQNEQKTKSSINN